MLARASMHRADGAQGALEFLGGMIAVLPVLVDWDVVDVAGILRITAPWIADVVEVVGAEHVTAKSPALSEALFGHVACADADVVQGAHIPTEVVQAGAVGF